MNFKDSYSENIQFILPVETRPVGFVNPSDVAVVRHPGLKLVSIYILLNKTSQKNVLTSQY